MSSDKVTKEQSDKEQTAGGPTPPADAGTPPEEGNDGQLVEKGSIVFENETASEKITVGIEHYESGLLSVDVVFDPAMIDDGYSGLIAGCASHLVNMLKGMGE